MCPKQRLGEEVGCGGLASNNMRRLRENKIDDMRAREIGQVATLMFTLGHTPLPLVLSGDYATASDHADEVVALADEKGAPLWKALGTMMQGVLMGLTGEPAGAVQRIANGIRAYRAVGSTIWIPFHLCHLAKAHAELGQLDDAWHCITEAMSAVEKTKETWSEAEVHRVAGELVLKQPRPDVAEAQACFERALAIARVVARQETAVNVRRRPRTAWSQHDVQFDAYAEAGR